MYWRQLKLVVDRSEITASQQNLKSLLIWSTSYYWENLRGLWTSSEGSGLKEIFSPNCLDWKFDPYLTAGKTQRALDLRNFQPELLGLEIWSTSYYWENSEGSGLQEIFSPNCSDWKFDPYLTTGKTSEGSGLREILAQATSDLALLPHRNPSNTNVCVFVFESSTTKDLSQQTWSAESLSNSYLVSLNSLGT